jgi:hypothetical protein
VSTALNRDAAPNAAMALDHTFLVMLATLVIASALLLCLGRRTYPRDVAAAMATELLAGAEAAPLLLGQAR